MAASTAKVTLTVALTVADAVYQQGRTPAHWLFREQLTKGGDLQRPQRDLDRDQQHDPAASGPVRAGPMVGTKPRRCGGEQLTCFRDQLAHHADRLLRPPHRGRGGRAPDSSVLALPPLKFHHLRGRTGSRTEACRLLDAIAAGPTRPSGGGTSPPGCGGRRFAKRTAPITSGCRGQRL
jgi:hypothetical protein